MIKSKMNLHHTQSFNLPSILLHLRNLPKFLFPHQLWGEFPEAAKQMVIEYNKKIKVVSPKPHFHCGKSKPNPTLHKPNSNLQQVHLHEKDDPTENQPPETPTQTMVHECLSVCGTDPSDIHNVMSVFNAKCGILSQDSPRKIQVHQRYVFSRANQSTNHLIDRGANGGLVVLKKTHRKINIVGIDDHELTGLNVITAAALLDTQRVLSLESSINMSTLAQAGLPILLDKWDGSTARLMTDPKLLVVPKELKPLMNLAWSTCTPSKSLLLMIFNNIPMSSSSHLTLGMLQFWTMALHLPYLKKSTKKLMIPCFKIQFLMNLENSNIGWYTN